MEVSDLLPPRTMSDRLAQRVRVRLGGEEYVLPALATDDSDAWLAKLDANLAGVFRSLDDQADAGEILGMLAVDMAPFFDLLREYDKTKSLPTTAKLRKTATKWDVFTACLEVWRAENPLVDTGLAAVTETANRTSSLPQLMSALLLSLAGMPRSSERTSAASDS